MYFGMGIMKKRYWIAILCAVLALVLTVAAASADEGDVYGRMTDETDLHDGDRIILVSDDGSYYQAMATDFSGMQVIVTGNAITEQDGMLALTLTETEGGWLLAANDGYLAADGGALTIVSDQADAAVWTISIASDGTATISCADGSIVFAEQDGAYRFFCGEGGNEIAIYNATFEPEHHAFGDGLWWSFADGKLTIGGSGDMPDFASADYQPWASIRSEITEVEIQDGVTSIGAYAFSNCTQLTELTIPNSVANIVSFAFYKCTGLSEITIPDGVTSIGDRSFRDCTGLVSVTIGSGIRELTGFWGCSGIQEITIPNTVTSIGDNAFHGCTGLSEITIPNSVTIILDAAFYNCTGLVEIAIPDSVIDIGHEVFSGCMGLQNVALGNGIEHFGSNVLLNTAWWDAQNDGVVYLDYILVGVKGTCGQIVRIKSGTKVIAAYAFYLNKQITKVTIPDGVSDIGASAFYGCTALTSVSIGNGITSIYYGAFNGCTGLTSITIPDSVTSIGGDAFSGCTGLQSVTIPDSVTTISSGAFSGCTGLTSLTMPCSASIGSNAFTNCTAVTNVHLTKGTGAIPDYPNQTHKYTPWYISRNNSLTIILDEDIENIGFGAFKECYGLTSITMPCSANICYHAFYGCTSITDVHLTKGSGTMPAYHQTSNTYNYYQNTPWYQSRNTAMTVTLDNGIHNIGDYAFHNCTGLTSITIPDSVTSIGTNAFSCCAGLESVTVGNGVTSIGDYAFYYCTELTSITIPDSVTVVGSNAFSYCTGLESITIGNSVTSIGESAYTNCTGLTEITIPGSVTSIDSSAFSYCTELQSVTISNGVISIGDCMFLGCTRLSEITIPDSVTSIGESAFYDCTDLESIMISDSVTSIGGMAFYRCTGLQSVTIGDGLTNIGSSAFSGCTGLTEITIPDSVTSIGSSAFSGCTGLESSMIGSSMTYVADWMFSDCTSLTSVTISSSVTSIGTDAFYNCTGLSKITIPDSVTSIGSYAFSGCTELTELTIPCSAAIKSQNIAFLNCNSICNVRITRGTGIMTDYDHWHIGNGVIVSNAPWFYSGTNDLQVTIENGITNIGENAFYGCTGLSSIEIPNGVTTIDPDAFFKCTELTSIAIPGSMTDIGWGSFLYCSQLKDVYYSGTYQMRSRISIPSFNEELENAFWHYLTPVSIEMKTLPNKLTYQEGETLDLTGGAIITYYDYDIVEEELLTYDMISGFDNTKAGTQTLIVTFDEQTTTFDVTVTHVPGEPVIENKVDPTCTEKGHHDEVVYCTYCGEELSRETVEDDPLGHDLVHHDAQEPTCTEIGWEEYDTCSRCEYSTYVELPALGHNPGEPVRENELLPTDTTGGHYDEVVYCTRCGLELSREYITVKPLWDPCGDELFCLLDPETGTLKIKGTGTMFAHDDLPWKDRKSEIRAIVIETGAAEIGERAFLRCENLSVVTIPSSVTAIGEAAFLGCSALTEIEFPEGLTVIGDSAFSQCTGLAEITLPDGITTVGEDAFFCCTGLESLTLPCSADTDSGAFDRCESLTSIHVTKGTGTWVMTVNNDMPSPWAYSSEQPITVILDDGILNIGKKAFMWCEELVSITIPDSVTSIDENAFAGCIGLTEITLPNGLTTVGMQAFDWCTELTDVYYHGTRRMRTALTIASYNVPLTGAEWHYLPVNAIEWKTLPSKLQYQEGDALNVTGGVITAYYDYEIVEEEPLTADMVTGFDNTTAGEQTLTVTFEGKTLTYTVLVSHVPGEPVQENEVAPTCLADGEYDEVVYCSGCGEELSREHIDIPALGHDLVHHDAQAATCTEIGWEAYDTCSRCDYTTYEEIPALGHTPGEPVIENEVPPTYAEEGHYDEVVYCTRCSVELERHKHEIERLPFEGTVEWNPEDVKFKGTTAYVIANGKAQTPRFTVKNKADGSVIDPASYDYEYRENINAGTGYVIVTFKGDYSGECRGTFKIYLPATTTTTVVNVKDGIKLSWSKVAGADGYVIYRRAWSSTTGGWTDFVRWNNTKELNWLDTKVYAGTRYQYGIKAYFNKRLDPIAGVMIGGNVGDNFNLGEVGPLKTTVRITTRTLNSVTAGTKQMTVKWGASSVFTGYQIKYATDKNFTKNVVAIKITDPKTAQTVIKNLTSGTTYYVTVRSYHEFNGMTYFGEWSNVKNCKVK